MKAPFPWFGGKRKVAPQVWRRFGQPAVYAEPFAGSLAVLLNRPGWEPGVPWVETVNDLDGYVANAWRAILHDPDATAHAADWPCNEADLHARHAWLVEQRQRLLSRLMGDPDWFDAKIAGWWLWGLACWIGGEFCSGRGRWVRREVAPGDWRLVEESGADYGVTRRLVHLNSTGAGVTRRTVRTAPGGTAGDGLQGLTEWMRALSARLQQVRVCCGDWARVITPSALCPSVRGACAVFLDPPYADAERDQHTYACEDMTVAHAVRQWCLAAPVEYRIALCGYEGEHEQLGAAGWSVHAWTAHGGMAHHRGAGSGGNNERERIWFSPACLQPGAEVVRQQSFTFERPED